MDVCRRCSCAIVNILACTQAEGLYYQDCCSNGNEHSTFKQKGISPADSCVVYKDVLRQSRLGMFVASIFSFSECLNSAFQLNYSTGFISCVGRHDVPEAHLCWKQLHIKESSTEHLPHHMFHFFSFTKCIKQETFKQVPQHTQHGLFLKRKVIKMQE